MWFPMATHGLGDARTVSVFAALPIPRRMESSKPIPLPSKMASNSLSTVRTGPFATGIPAGMTPIRLAVDPSRRVEAGGNTGLLFESRPCFAGPETGFEANSVGASRSTDP